MGKDPTGERNGQRQGQRHFVLVFALFSGWLLSFPFEGRIFFELFAAEGQPVGAFSMIVVLFHLIGLFGARWLVRDRSAARRAIRSNLLLCAFLSGAYFLEPAPLWYAALPAAALAAGVCLASFGYLFQHLTLKGQRFRTAADLLIASNLLMILLNGTTTGAAPDLVLAVAILLLLLSYLLMARMDRFPGAATEIETPADGRAEAETAGRIYPLRPLLFLCLFIFIATIDAGLMYRVVNPAYAHLGGLAVWYWSVPYVAVLFLLRNWRRRMDRVHFLYAAISMIGLAFLGFMVLDRSMASFFLVNTLLMAAFGIFDLYWWSILGELLDEWHNRAALFGAGLGANVAGILAGGFIGTRLAEPSVIALAVVFAVLFLLPLLNRVLSDVRSDHAFLAAAAAMAEADDAPDIATGSAAETLTRRELEIARHLLAGRTYRMIAAELHLSENTVKTHVKNIYSKLGIQSKGELIRLLLAEQDLPVY